MPRTKRKRLIVESDSENESVTRQNSLRVNLSFTLNLSDSDHGLLRKITTTKSDNQNDRLLRTVEKYNTGNTISHGIPSAVSVANDTVVDAAGQFYRRIPLAYPNNVMRVIKEKDQQLNKSCLELKNAIISKTKSFLDDELTKKTSEILLGCSDLVYKIPSDPINIRKDDETIKTERRERQNPIGINSVSNIVPLKDSDKNEAIQNIAHNGFDCGQNIVNTPKKGNVKTLLDKTFRQIKKMPATRLFQDNSPVDSISELNSPPPTNVVRSNISNKRKANDNGNIYETPNKLNNATSPILRRGTRQTKICDLSQKRKLIAEEKGDPRVSTNATNESFINRPPLMCSSLIEKREKACNKSIMDEHTKTIVLEEQKESSQLKKTIDLVNNDYKTNTIVIDNSSSGPSSMEITTISARTPIVRKSFQQIIRKSFKFDKADIPGNNIKKSIAPNLRTDGHKISAKSNTGNTESQSACRQGDCGANTVRTSNVNTRLDDVTLADRVIPAKYIRPGNTKQFVDQTSKINATGESPTSTKMRYSLRVNTSLDSLCKSPGTIQAATKPQKQECPQLQSIDSNSHREKGLVETRSHRPTNGTTRASMQMNTSLDSVEKSPNAGQTLNYNKMLSTVEDACSSTGNSQVFNLQRQSSDDAGEIENVPLLERIQIRNRTAFRNKKPDDKQHSSNERFLKSSMGKNTLDSRTSHEPESSRTETEMSKASNNKESQRITKSNETQNTRLQKGDVENSEANAITRKSMDNTSVSSTASELSVVEATPFPASRSLLFKTIIKNNIATNTLNPRKLVGNSDDEENGALHLTLSKKIHSSANKRNSVYDTRNPLGDDSSNSVVVYLSDESSASNESNQEPVKINESSNDTGNENKSKISQIHKPKKQRESRNSEPSDEKVQNRRAVNKRKLHPLRENSQISLSPAEMAKTPQESAASKDVGRKKRGKTTQKKKEDDVEGVRDQELAGKCDYTENEISIERPRKKKQKPKPRKIKSKKIVVKKVTNLTLLSNMMENDEETLATDDSLREFDLRQVRHRARKKSNSTNHKIVIVVTGHGKDDKELVKNIVKNLGSATLQTNVTLRTTHVISSDFRTVNLLKGIVRGCWIVSLAWALKSLETGKWLEPSPYEMSHLAKAVQANRRDRQLFGKAYIPEMFITCGPIYIENGTTPPASTLKELVKTAEGIITEDPNEAKIIIGLEGLRANWILDSITTGEMQPCHQYKRNRKYYKK